MSIDQHPTTTATTRTRLSLLFVLAAAPLILLPAKAEAQNPNLKPPYTVAYLDSLLELYPIKPKQEFTSTLVQQDSAQSVHLNQLRTKLALHKLPQHYETIYLIRGVMRVRVGYDKRTVGAGTIYSFPADTPRELFNMGQEPCVYLSVITPGVAGGGRVIVQEE